MARISLLLCFLFLTLMNSNFILHSSALQFDVGGQDGWVLNPKESYDHWAQRLRFQVNDSVLFRYSNATDSVLAVGQTDYDNCNVNNPVIQLYGGQSVFLFGHSGPFYFITGNKSNCDNGQKVLIRVLAIRSPPPLSPTTPPSSSPPSAAPIPTPPGSSPAPSPSQSPTPSGSVPPTSSSPGGSQTPPAGSPTSPVGPGGGNPPADINAPSGSQNKSCATATFTSTITVSFVLIMALGWSTVSH